MVLILLSQVLFLPLSASEAEAETRVTITFAAGGVACGVYFFLQFTFKSSMAMQLYQNDATALFNHVPDGWQIVYPSLSLIGDGRFKAPPERSPETVHMEILKLMF